MQNTDSLLYGVDNVVDSEYAAELLKQYTLAHSVEQPCLPPRPSQLWIRLYSILPGSFCTSLTVDQLDHGCHTDSRGT